ncbi:MAG TPA: IPT/TIG domain-containing protein [Thermoanaerobaculia bacterium]|nr:IPT/TIG domain-containing protein [Thermoanaerobaculia bacterium]
MKRLIAALLLTAGPLAAQPVITSVSPNGGPVAGGTVVTIKGSGFEACPICSPPLPPYVAFGGTPAYSVRIVDTETLEVVTAPHFPKTVGVTVDQWNGVATTPNAFTFTGKVEDGFEQVLLPIFVPPLQGAYGSLFNTHLRLAASSSLERSWILGLTPFCALATCVYPDPLEVPFELTPGIEQHPQDLHYTGAPGQFVFIPKMLPEPFMNLRVFDSSRDAFNFGTELPVVPLSEFTLRPIKLLGVPGDPRFRNTLRIYAEGETSVTVVIDDMAWHLPLLGGANALDPAYAEFTDFPAGIASFDVTIIPSSVTPPMPGLNAPRVWAFISVTNNETQLITTITPQ